MLSKYARKVQRQRDKSRRLGFNHRLTQPEIDEIERQMAAGTFKIEQVEVSDERVGDVASPGDPEATKYLRPEGRIRDNGSMPSNEG